MGLINKAAGYYRDRGLTATLRYAVPYGLSLLVRASPFYPPSRYNRIRVADNQFKWAPHYKAENAAAIEAAISTGDDVIVVGAGHGVTTVAAAVATGESGTVTSYEASAEQVEQARQTVALNDVADRCSVEHAIVSRTYDTRGGVGNAEQVDPADLPACDVLEMDCEGAEIDILPNLVDPPDTLVVETHPQFYDDPDAATLAIENAGYEIDSRWNDPAEGEVLLVSC